MAELPPNVRLDLINTPENVVLVREMLSGVAEAIDLDGSDLNDIRTAVTEACNNVVLHAYQAGNGPMEVEVHLARSALRVAVRDHGTGIQTPSHAIDPTAFGIGLHVIRTLAHRLEFREVADGGTEVRMEFAVPTTSVFEPRPEGDLGLPALAAAESPITTTVSLAPAESSTTTTVSLAPVGLARAVLPRLMSALAARAHFSTDRISDTQLLADALVAHVPASIDGGQLTVAIRAEPHNLELRIGPLSAGRGQRLIGGSNLAGVGRVIEKLTDRHGVTSAESYEVLNLHLLDRR